MIIKEIRKNTKCAMSSKRRDICHFVWGRGIYYNDLERFYLSINSKELCDEVFSRYRNTFLGGILPLCTLGLNRGLVLATLEAVILICGSYFFDRKYTKILLWSIFTASFLTMPEIRLFCPVLIYILAREQEPVLILSGGLLGTLILAKMENLYQ